MKRTFAKHQAELGYSRAYRRPGLCPHGTGTPELTSARQLRLERGEPYTSYILFKSSVQTYPVPLPMSPPVLMLKRKMKGGRWGSRQR